MDLPDLKKKRDILFTVIAAVLIGLAALAIYEHDQHDPQISFATSPPAGQYMTGIYGHALELTRDGGFIVAGYVKYLARGKTDHDIWVMKVAGSGDPEWTKTFGGASTDRAWSVKQTPDGDFLVVGESYSFGDSYQAVVLNLDKNGAQKWFQLIGGAHEERGSNLCLSAEGTAFISGAAYSDSLKRPNFLLCEVNSKGKLLSERSFEHELSGGANSVAMLTNTDIVLLGNLQNDEDHSIDFGLLRINKDGEVIHQSRFGSIQSDEAKTVLAASDGGYLVAGTEFKDILNKSDVVVYKFDASDKLEWKSYYGGTALDGGENMIATSDGGYALIGYTRSYGAGYKDVYALKIGIRGETEWSQAFGGEKTDWGYDIEQTPDEGFLISAGSKSTGHNETDLWIIKLDKNGLKEWDRVYGSPESGLDKK